MRAGAIWIAAGLALCCGRRAAGADRPAPAAPARGVSISTNAPFGCCFVEGEPGRVAFRVDWPGAERRLVRVQTRLTDDRGVAHGTRTAEADLAPGGEIVLPLNGADGRALGPGLYTCEGTLSTDASRHPVRVQFGILNRDLHEVPTDEIPAWVGIASHLSRVKEPDRIREGYALMNKLGVRTVRIPIIWVDISKGKDQFDWTSPDLRVDLAEQYGMRAVALLGWWGPYWPDHMQDLRQRGVRPLYTPEGRQYWTDAYFAVVLERYGDRVKYIELLNEPNAFWNEDDPMQATGFGQQIGSPVYYADLVLRCWRAGRALDPSVHVMGALASCNWGTDIPRLLELGIGETLSSGFVLHTYGSHIDMLMGVADLFAAHGFEVPGLAITETGVIAHSGDPRHARAQANSLIDVFLSTPSAPGEILALHWYTLMDDYTVDDRFGVLHKGMQADQAAVAFHTAARLLAGATNGVTRRQGKLRIHRVEREGRLPLTGFRSIYAQPVPVTLVRRGGAPVRAWDLMGRPVDIPWRGNASAFTATTDFTLIEGDVEVVPETHLELRPRPPHGVRARAFTVRDTTTEATLRLNSADARIDFSHEREVLLFPGMNAYDIDLGPIRPGDSIPLRASLRWPGGAAEASERIEFYPVNPMPSGPADVQMPSADAAHVMIMGEDAYIAWGWTDEGMVLWIDQRDEVHIPCRPDVAQRVRNRRAAGAPARETPCAGWEEDGVLVAFFSEGADGGGRRDFGFGLGADGPMAFGLEGPHVRIELEAERTEARTRYRALFPFDQLPFDGRPGETIRARVELYDPDGGGESKCASWPHRADPISRRNGATLTLVSRTSDRDRAGAPGIDMPVFSPTNWVARGSGWAGDLASWQVHSARHDERDLWFLENAGGKGSSLSAQWDPTPGSLDFEMGHGWKWGNGGADVLLVLGSLQTDWRLHLQISQSGGPKKYRASWVRNGDVREAPVIEAPDLVDGGSRSGNNPTGYAARLRLQFRSDPARFALYRDGKELSVLDAPTGFIPSWFTLTDIWGTGVRLYSLSVRPGADDPPAQTNPPRL
jgi:hypothetical protein